MRLIDADAYDFPGDLKYEPTIDAVPVVHSWWEISEYNDSLIPCVGYKCHNCGSKYARIDTEKKEYNYCPHCGARMDGRMKRFPKDCWDKGCNHFHVTDMSVDDLLCACDVNGMECDACDEDFCFLTCPLKREDGDGDA